MRKIWLITRREYLYNFRKRSFLFSAFGVPILTILLMVVVIALTEQQVTATGGLGDIGYVDLADPALTVADVEVPDEFIAFDAPEAAAEALAAGDIGAYFVITREYWADGAVETYAPRDMPEGIQDQIGDFIRANVVTRAPAAYVERLSDPVNLVFRTMGGGIEFEEEGLFAVIMMPYVFAIIFTLAMVTTSQFLMLGVAAEKENRVMEILVTSSTPEQILWGKVLGLGFLGLTQVITWVAVGLLLGVLAGENALVAPLLRLPLSLVVIMLVYFALGYLLYSAIMAGIGASVSAEQEGRQIAGLFTFVAVIPMVFSFFFLENPNGAAPVLLSLFPFTAPVAMLMRLPMTAVPAWQFLLSIAMLVVAMMVAVWISARVFRLGMLMYGKRLRLGDIINALRSSGQPAAQTVVKDGDGTGGAGRVAQGEPHE